MPSFKIMYSGKLRLILLFVMLLVFGGMVWIFFSSRNQTATGEKKILPFPKATISIGKIQHTATRDGKTEWMLEAGSGQYLNEDKKVIIKDLTITFFLEDKGTALLKAEEGTLFTETNDVHVVGNIILENQGYRVVAQKIDYDHESRILSSEAPITIENDSLFLTADRFKLNMAENKTYLLGHVKGFLGEKKNE